jgi:hypothetical protein
MTDTVKAVVKEGHQCHYFDKDNVEQTALPSTGPFDLTLAQFEEHELMGSVRRATRDDKATPSVEQPRVSIEHVVSTPVVEKDQKPVPVASAPKTDAPK